MNQRLTLSRLWISQINIINNNLPLEMNYVIISQNVPCDAYRVLTWELQTETISTPRPRPSPSSSVSRIFSGRNCAVLKQIYFNTRHDIWTTKKKKRTFLYSFIKEQKKKKKTSGFLSFPVLHSDFATFDVFFCHEEATTTRLDGMKMCVGCWSRSFFLCHWCGDCPVDSKVYRKVFVLNMPM